MFTSPFKEASAGRVELPGKSLSTVLLVLDHLYPTKTLVLNGECKNDQRDNYCWLFLHFTCASCMFILFELWGAKWVKNTYYLRIWPLFVKWAFIALIWA